MTSAVAVRLLERETPTSTSGGSMSLPILMFVMFYGYRNLLNISEKLIYDIFITFISISLANIVAYKISISKRKAKKYGFITPVVILVMFVSYAILTFYPPEIPIFYDKNFGGYGINHDAHDHEHE